MMPPGSSTGPQNAETSLRNPCQNQERLTDFLLAETALRNKQNERAVKAFTRYLLLYSDHSTAEQANYNLIQAKYNLAKEAEEETEDLCSVLSNYKEAMSSYFEFIEKYKDSNLLDQAEKLYGKILASQDRSQKACDEHN